MEYIVNDSERLLVFKNGILEDCKKAGKYRSFSFLNKTYEHYTCEGVFQPNQNLEILLKNNKLKEELEVIDVEEHELLLYYRDNIFSGVFYQGKHAFWNVIGKNSFRKIDLREKIELDDKLKNVFSKVDLYKQFDIVEIEEYNIVLYYKDGIFEELLHSGGYAIPKKYYKNTFNKFDLRVPIVYNEIIKKMLDKNPEFIEQFDIIEVNEKELLIWSQNNKYKSKYLTGKYLFWNKLEKNSFDIINLNNIEVIEEKYYNILDRLSGLYTKFEVKEYEVGLLIMDNQYDKTLNSGTYYFWNGTKKLEMIPIDLRIKQLDMQGQEILTRDKISLRLNFVTQYKILDPIKNYKEINNLENQIYISLQMILREYVGTQTLEQLLETKNEIAEFVLEKIKLDENKYGVEFIEAGIKDIILPGDIKEILNTVLIAEKTALANTIKRREETASTRSLLNTAKLMEENQVLYKLKEMEYIEKVVEKIGNIEISGNGNILEELAKIFAKN